VFLSSLFIFLATSPGIGKINHLLLLGLVLGWGILTKYNCLIFLPTYLMILIMFYRKDLWRLAVPVLAITGLMLVPWFKHTSHFYGQILALNPGYDLSKGVFGPDIAEILHAIRNLFWSFWAAAGRAYEIHLPVIYYSVLFGGLSLMSGSGLIGLLLKFRDSCRLDAIQTKLVVLFLLNSAILVLGSLWYSLSYDIMTSWGKNLFVFILPVSLLISLGWRKVWSNKIWLYSLPLLLLTVHLIYLIACVYPYFHG
jgi:hypothetical protein